MNEINLLPQKQANRSRVHIVLRILRITSIISLVVLPLSSLVIFALKLQSPLPKLQKEENAILTQLNSSKDKTTKLFIIRNRLNNVQSILSHRKDYAAILGSIFEKKSSNILVRSFIIDKGELSLTISSPSLSSIDIFLNNLVELVIKKEILQKLTLNSLALDQKTGRYFLSVEARLL